jgi:hypothetical protein
VDDPNGAVKRPPKIGSGGPISTAIEPADVHSGGMKSQRPVTAKSGPTSGKTGAWRSGFRVLKNTRPMPSPTHPATMFVIKSATRYAAKFPTKSATTCAIRLGFAETHVGNPIAGRLAPLDRRRWQRRFLTRSMAASRVRI